jgi:hypothetical protein
MRQHKDFFGGMIMENNSDRRYLLYENERRGKRTPSYRRRKWYMRDNDSGSKTHSTLVVCSVVFFAFFVFFLQFVNCRRTVMVMMMMMAVVDSRQFRSFFPSAMQKMKPKDTQMKK